MPRSLTRLALLVLAGTVTAIAFVGAAQASRVASSRQQVAVTQAVHRTSVAGLDRVPQRQYRVSGARISTVSSSWAAAELVARPAYRSSFQNVSVVAVRLGG